ncbi:MAG: 30S ribosomal protein S6 [Candidatus Saccharibacteria bacterium]|nr:30S ribosomal protein S6 [Candidatus Saccharibacteria bacterium]
MKNYELTVLFHPDLEMNLDPALDKVKKLIESNGGKIVKEENDGKKRMAYSIAAQDFAVYYYFEVELPAASLAKISSVLNITDEVIRYLLVAVDERKLKLEAHRKARKASSEEDEKEEEKE